MKKTPVFKKEIRTEWDLGLLYKSPTDPKIEADMKAFEGAFDDFAAKFDIDKKEYLRDPEKLLNALRSYEKLLGEHSPVPLFYFHYLVDLDSRNTDAAANSSLMTARLIGASNKVRFFELSIGAIPQGLQKKFLSDDRLERYHYFLKHAFEGAKHLLSEPEEKIVALKSQPAYDMWVAHNERLMSVRTVPWKKKDIPLAQALNMTSAILKRTERHGLADATSVILKSLGDFAEGEINAVFTNKKIDDELRGYSEPYSSTVREYHNDPHTVESLVKAVSDKFSVAHRFYRLKAKLLKQKKLAYADRAAKIGDIKSRFTFERSTKKLKKVFGALNPLYSHTIDSYLSKGQIDAYPRIGKQSGAYCSSSFSTPTFLLLNDIGEIRSYETLAHELGHAFHSELSRAQGPIYSEYSYALAETASTLFESIASEAVYDELSDKEKAIMLHDRINSDIATVFRQIACFNFELDLHKAVRAKGYIPKKEIALMHNKRMMEYLGPAFELKENDGYFFVTWGHIRRFFYVYSYAFGMLVSKALLRRYKADPSFWKKIEQFLSSGGKDSPENIMKEIGIDITKPDFWMEGLREIEDDIARLERLVK